MKITFRNYSLEPFFTDDYRKVREFLIRVNQDRIINSRMLWGAWEWATTHGWRDHGNVGKMGLWEDGDKLVAVALYECPLGEGFLIVDEEYSHLKTEVVVYAKDALIKDGKLRLSLPDGDLEYTRAARSAGFRPTSQRDCACILDINELQSYSLPEGYSFVDMSENWNWQQYSRVLWRGFNSEGRPPHDDSHISMCKRGLSSPMIIPEVVMSVVAPDGNYVSHCGMWYRPGDSYCYVEPVATDPDYRKIGLGKAVVLEAIRRCGKFGARQAIVGSEQQFYFNIGFYPTHYLTHWELIP
ncbi:MAG: GNAT family N-acetyltransferase [Defluviitaleaceae bacterium]|nr:GNAT family N-acetyltransferase [Defluviitaleaceae bacterium]